MYDSISPENSTRNLDFMQNILYIFLPKNAYFENERKSYFKGGSYKPHQKSEILIEKSWKHT